jgi:hypothetical protein
LDSTDLIVLSIEIENQIDACGELRPRAGKESTLFSISRHEGGYLRFFRHDLPPQVRHQLEDLDPGVALQDHATVRKILAQHTLCDTVFAGKKYYFERRPSPAEFPDAVCRQGCYVVLVDGSPVSWAWTADSSDRAAELAVETTVPYRRRGYGRQVAAAWAAHVLGEGKVAFYSHELKNVASEALARSLGVTQYAVMTTYGIKARG